MKKYWWVLVLPVILAGWWILGHGGAATIIHFSIAKQASVASVVSTNGKVEAATWSAARSETSGVVRTVDVQRGQTVRAGQPLVTLDATSARADLATARAREQQALTEQKNLQAGGRASTVADLTDRIATARAAVAVAERVYESDKRLFASQAATKLQVDNDSDSLKRARLGLEALENQKRTLVTSGDEGVAGARVKDAQAAVALAEHRAQLVVVRSPGPGTVYRFDLKVGAYLQPGDFVANIGNLNQVRVLIYVDEPDLGRVGLDMPVMITSESRPGQKWTGRVDKLPTEVVSQGTRTVGEVSTIIDNPQHDLLPGVSVNATITSKVVENALVVPKIGLRRLGATDGVYKLGQDNTLVWTPVKTGISDINSVQILQGVSSGDKVADRVIEPTDAEIRNGMLVKPVFN